MTDNNMTDNNYLNHELIPRMNKAELCELIAQQFVSSDDGLMKLAGEITKINFGGKVYIRGLVEISNFCKNGCYYCGISRSNKNAERYRLDSSEIIDSVENGYSLGFRSFVFQGGEDPYFTDKVLTKTIKEIKTRFSDCAITLSLGERSPESYKKLYDAGADRYLLRHETADNSHYSKLHPDDMSPVSRKNCLAELKKIGFQTGAGFMVGSPYQTIENLADDIIFLREFQPHMVGIGPFIPQKDTPFGNMTAGTLRQTLVMLSLTRITLPKAMLPSTTALGTIHPGGRELGLLSGGNVVMPNLSPVKNRKKYALYDNKIATGAESVEGLNLLIDKIISIGLIPDFSRGDHSDYKERI